MANRLYTLEITTTDAEIERVYSELFEGTMLSLEVGAITVFEALLVDTEADVYLDGKLTLVTWREVSDPDAESTPAEDDIDADAGL